MPAPGITILSSSQSIVRWSVAAGVTLVEVCYKTGNGVTTGDATVTPPLPQRGPIQGQVASSGGQGAGFSHVTFRVRELPPPPVIEVEPAASVAQGCDIDGVSGAVVRMRNSGDGAVTFTVTKDGAVVATVTVGAGSTASRVIDMAEDETATFGVSASGMATVSRTLTNDCVRGAQFRTPPRLGGGKSLPVTGVGHSAKAIAGGIVALMAAAGLTVAIRRRDEAEAPGL